MENQTGNKKDNSVEAVGEQRFVRVIANVIVVCLRFPYAMIIYFGLLILVTVM